MKLSLSMIVRGGSDPESLRQCLLSIAPHVDELCIVETLLTDFDAGQNALERAAREVADPLDIPCVWERWVDADGNVERGWISDFSVARNKAQDLVSGDVWCCIDSDTVLVNGAAWRADVEKYFSDPSLRSGFMRVRYDYDKDDQGRTTAVVPTKMVFRSGITEWEWPVHEQAKITQGSWHPIEALNSSYYLDHRKRRAEHDEATERNFWIIDNYMRHGGEMHARMWISMATCQIARGQYGAALAALRECLSSNPNEIDRWKALLSLGGVMTEYGRYDEALSAYGEMAALHPERSSPWVYIAQVQEDAGRHNEALAALGRVGRYPGVPEGSSYNPVFLQYSPLYTEARARAALGEWPEAVAAFEQCLEIKPDLQAARDHMEALKRQIELSERYAHYKTVAQNYPSIWKHAPEDMAILPEVGRARLPKRPKGRLPVMIFCGASLGGPWGPSSLAGGIGGSEEAVIYLSRELVKQGAHVEVYAMPSEQDMGVDDHGVVWSHWGAWEDKPGIFIQWRGTTMIERAGQASARYIWLHDRQNNLTVYDDLLHEMVDGVFCLSENHAQPLIDHGWYDKVIFTENGLPPSIIEADLNLDRKKRSFAFYSSPDRGLDSLLSVWRDIRYAVADATLDIYYGFTPYYLNAMTRRPDLKSLKNRVESQIASLEGTGVTFHGMVGHDELHKSMSTKDFWLYPTEWPETSCITAMKCMALGCIPITSGYEDSGLVETLNEYDMGPQPGLNRIYSDRDEMDIWVKRVIEVAKKDREELDGFRAGMSKWAKEKYSWSKIASHWLSMFPDSAKSRLTATRKGSPGKASSTPS